MMTSERAKTIHAQVEGFRQRLHDLQREMEPLVDRYENFGGIYTKEQQEEMDALGMVWSAWWDLTDTIGFLRAAQRRLRNGDGIPADAEKER